MPLGESDAASVFVVREDAASPRLLRLKRWRTPAPAGFIDGFERLRAHLLEWRPPTIVLPVTAWMDAKGCPSVVTDFRQGDAAARVRQVWMAAPRQSPLRVAAAAGESSTQHTSEVSHTGQSSRIMCSARDPTVRPISWISGSRYSFPAPARHLTGRRLMTRAWCESRHNSAAQLRATLIAAVTFSAPSGKYRTAGGLQVVCRYRYSRRTS